MAGGGGGGESSCKMVLVGDGSVGKTSLVERITADGFGRVYRQTIGADFFEKKVVVGQGVRLVAQLWDIGGQSLGSKMLPTYLSGADGVLLCYDVTSHDSLSNVEDWLDRVRPACPKAAFFLLGNKIDLVDRRAVTQEQHDAFVAKHKFKQAFLVSARSGDSVLRAFYAATGIAAGSPLDESELAFHDTVVEALVAPREEPDATDGGAKDQEIARKDREADERRRKAIAAAAAKPQSTGCACTLA